MSETAFHTIDAPLATAVERVPPVVRAGADDVVVERQGSDALWRWRGSYDAGTISLAALSPTQSRLTITAQTRSALPLADAVTVALYGALERQWHSPAAASTRQPMRGRTKVALVTAALLIPVLAITGMRILAPPKAMDVASAVAQFRAQSSEPAADVATAVGASGNTTARARTSPTDRPASRPAGGRRATDTRTNAAPRPQHAAQPQASAGRAPRRDRQSAAAPAPQRTQTEQRRPQGTAAAPPARTQPERTSPEEGVYRYATRGSESIDRPSDRHDYPSETAMSIRATDCGFTGRWQPLENRWDEMTVCRRNGRSLLPRLSTHREFYGQSNDSNYRCGATNYAFLPKPGATWSGTCADGDAKMHIRGRTIAHEPVRVGDETVNTVRYTIEARITGGDAEGTWTAERWVDPETGLLIRVEAQTRATSDSSVGTVQYREQLSLRLLSLTPQR